MWWKTFAHKKEPQKKKKKNPSKFGDFLGNEWEYCDWVAVFYYLPSRT
jgi:hypothetical protein